MNDGNLPPVRRSHYDDVLAFNIKFGLPAPVKPQLMPDELAAFRARFLEEELAEFEEAMHNDDLPGMADALVDLVYVAIGTALMMGLPWQRLWDEVQRSNMAKERAERAEQSKRGTSFDVIKPPGWTAPRIIEIIEGKL
jgi:predicted HAD superfamily Cof-like phosphohydrolase